MVKQQPQPIQNATTKKKNFYNNSKTNTIKKAKLCILISCVNTWLGLGLRITKKIVRKHYWIWFYNIKTTHAISSK